MLKTQSCGNIGGESGINSGKLSRVPSSNTAVSSKKDSIDLICCKWLDIGGIGCKDIELDDKFVGRVGLDIKSLSLVGWQEANSGKGI